LCARSARDQLAEQPLLGALGQRAARETLTLLRGCADEHHCHWTVRKRLLEEIDSRLTPTAEGTPSADTTAESGGTQLAVGRQVIG